MSNYLAVATVTACLAYLLHDVKSIVDGASVTFLRPDKLHENLNTPEAGINIYLYSGVPNSVFRNNDLPTRGRTGILEQLPQTALDLDYILSFYGDDAKFEPQRLMGWASSVLHDEPQITPEDIRAAVAMYSKYIAGSDLACQDAPLWISNISLNLEMLSKLWSVMFRTPYLLSSTYQVSVVTITPTLTPPAPAPSVLDTSVAVISSGRPQIASITPSTAAPGDTVVLTGSGFDLGPATVTFGDVGVPVTPMSGSLISVQVPSMATAGTGSVVVSTAINAATPIEPNKVYVVASNAVPFVVEPVVEHVEVQSGSPYLVAATFSPAAEPTQRVRLWLNGPSGSYVLDSLAHDVVTNVARFDVGDVAKGTYIARLQIDRAISVDNPSIKVTLS